MSLAIFDLDNTLIAGDSDHLWGQFLVERGIVDRDLYKRANDKFYRDYRQGTLDIYAFLRFALRPLRDNKMENLLRWRAEFLVEKIDPIVLAPALSLIERHRADGDELLIITATNAFITEPIAERFGIANLIATIPACVDGRFNGDLEGIPSYQHGKVHRLDAWLKETGLDLTNSTFYSDSHNDTPLLDRVEHPVAVDPDEQLLALAQKRGWKVISLRGT